MNPEDRDLGERLADGFGPGEAELDAMEARVEIPAPVAPRALPWVLGLTAAAAVVAMVGLTLVPPSMPDPLQQQVVRGTPPPPQAPVDAPHTFRAEAGTEVVRGDLRIALPPGGVRDAAGDAVVGTVTLRWSQDADRAPHLVTTAGTPLAAAALLEVHLTRGDAEALAWDGVAEVDLPVPGGAGDLALYHHDADAGGWVREGEGRREGDVFKAELRHFSWWAAAAEADRPTPPPPSEPEEVTRAPSPPLEVVPSPQAPPHAPLRLAVPERDEGPQVVLPVVHDEDALVPAGLDLDDLARDLERCAPEPRWTGVVLAQWVLRDGRAREVAAVSEPRSVGACVERRIRGWSFEPGSTGQVEVPFAFHPRED